MSEPINDGGPAFPVLNSGYNTVSKKWEPIGPIGMSLRDWFAGQALAGLMANPEYGGTAEEAAVYSLKASDAMLAAREKGKE